MHGRQASLKSGGHCPKIVMKWLKRTAKCGLTPMYKILVI